MKEKYKPDPDDSAHPPQEDGLSMHSYFNYSMNLPSPNSPSLYPLISPSSFLGGNCMLSAILTPGFRSKSNQPPFFRSTGQPSTTPISVKDCTLLLGPFEFGIYNLHISVFVELQSIRLKAKEPKRLWAWEAVLLAVPVQISGLWPIPRIAREKNPPSFKIHKALSWHTLFGEPFFIHKHPTIVVQ